MYPPCASQVITDVKTGSSPGFGSSLDHAPSQVSNGQMRLCSPLQLGQRRSYTCFSIKSFKQSLLDTCFLNYMKLLELKCLAYL